MNFRNLGKTIGLCIVLICIGGCRLPSQIAWSPDGKQAAWRRDTRLWLIDENGAVVKAFERSTLGGMTWSADSRTLYFTGEQLDNEAPANFQVRRNWLISPHENHATTQPTNSSGPSGKRGMGVYAYRDGEATPLFHVRVDSIAHLQLSPDERWLAMVAWNDKPERFELYAYSLASKHLYPLATSSGLGVCFTGASRLAFVEPDIAGERMEHQTGQLVEVVLDDAADALPRAPVLRVLPDRTIWLAALGENILLTSQAQMFPGKPAASHSGGDGEGDALNLYFYTRADGAVTAIAEEVGPLCASPDGKRILFEKLTPETDAHPKKSELAIMNSNGSDPHALRDMTESGKPMWPAWHGNDEITFVAAADQAVLVGEEENGKTKMLVDVVQYRLSPNSRSLEPLGTLSETWTDEMKPYFETNATQPTTPP